MGVDLFLQYALYIITFLMVLVALTGTGMAIQQKLTFRNDSRNPYRRFCRKCGQPQGVFGEAMYSGPSWWGKLGPVEDPSCRCHRYLRKDQHA